MANSKKLNVNRIKILIIITTIILVLLFIILERMHSNSKEAIIKRLISGIDNLNYSYTIDGEEASIKVLGKKAVKEFLNKDTIYIDYEKKSSVLVDPENKYAEYYENKGIEEMQYYKDFIDCFYQEYYEYKYIGKKDLNGKECIVVELVNKNYAFNRTNSIVIWINDSLNIVEKVENYNYNKKDKKLVDEKVFAFNTGTVSLEDVNISEKALKEYSSNTNN